MNRRLLNTGIKGCGKRTADLTFYKLRVGAESGESSGRLACGQQAEAIGGRRGMVLCKSCAEANRIKVSRYGVHKRV